MASPSETTLIVLGVGGGGASSIAPETAAFWQIVTAIGLTVTPLLAKLGRVAGSRVEPARATRSRSTPRSTLPRGGQVVILGFGRVGRMVADMLEAHDKDYLAVDRDIDAVARPGRKAMTCCSATSRRPELIERLRKRAIPAPSS